MEKTFCIFGDSVVQASYIESSWVELLRNYLEKKFSSDSVKVFNLGISGNTSEDIVKRFEFEASMRSPTDIVFAFGVNDSGYFMTPDKPIIRKDKFVRNINDLIIKAKNFTSRITFVGLVLGDDSILKPYPESSQGKSYDIKRVENYNQIISKISKKSNCKFVQLIKILNSNDFLDGLHPNEKGHKKIFNEIKKYF